MAKGGGSRYANELALRPERAECPNPSKVSYVSRRAAKEQAQRFRAKKAKGDLTTYLCPCGWFHLGRLAANIRPPREGVSNGEA